MKPETALQLQERLTREIQGLKATLDQLARPDVGTTMAGLKSGLTIALRSMQRTNQVLHDVVRAEAEPPAARNSFADLFRERRA